MILYGRNVISMEQVTLSFPEIRLTHRLTALSVLTKLGV